jgi:hypothetical protein
LAVQSGIGPEGRPEGTWLYRCYNIPDNISGTRPPRLQYPELWLSLP